MKMNLTKKKKQLERLIRKEEEEVEQTRDTQIFKKVYTSCVPSILTSVSSSSSFNLASISQSTQGERSLEITDYYFTHLACSVHSLNLSESKIGTDIDEREQSGLIFARRKKEDISSY